MQAGARSETRLTAVCSHSQTHVSYTYVTSTQPPSVICLFLFSTPLRG